MKNKLFFFFVLFISFNLSSLHIQAEAPKLSAKCMEKMKIRNEHFTSLIMKDVISSFNLDIDEQSYAEISSRDLDAAHLIYGGKEKDVHYKSLLQHFIVASRGEPRLFVRPQEAFLLYKEPDQTNVMVHLKLNESKWEVYDKKKKSGNKINFNILPCEKEYGKKKKEYYSN